MSAQAVPANEEIELRRRQARALGDPTRHRIYRTIEATDAPVTVAELTAAFGLNHNAIRQHLAVLTSAGLVVDELGPPAGPGRRPLLYRVDPSTAAAWGGANPYEQLSLLLVETLRSGRSPREVGVDAGRRLAARRRSTGGDPLDAFVALVASQGFEPHIAGTADHPDVVLDRCPFAAAAAADPSTVCALHLGLAEGMAAALDDDLVVSDLVVRNPKRAGCRIRLETHEGAPDHV